MTESTLDTHGSNFTFSVEESRHANNGFKFQESHRGCRIVEINLARFYFGDKIGWKRFGIDLETDFQSLLRTNARTNSTELLANDGAVKFQSVTPKGLITEGIEPERFTAGIDHRRGRGLDRIIRLVCPRGLSPNAPR